MKSIKPNLYSICQEMLIQRKIFTYQDIAKNLMISEKTIKNKSAELKRILSNYDILFKSKSGKGIELIGSNQSFSECFKYCELKEKQNIIYSSSVRQNIIIFMLFLSGKKITMGLLENLLYISRPSIHRDLIEIEKKLLRYEISLKKDRKNGIRIVCGEKRIRKFISNWSYELVDYKMEDFIKFPRLVQIFEYLHGDTINRITAERIIKDLCKTSNIYITKNDFNRYITFFLFSMLRLREGHIVNLNEKIINVIHEERNIFTQFKTKVNFINKHYNVQLYDPDLVYFTSVLISYSNINTNSDNHNQNCNISCMINEMLDIIDDNNKFIDKKEMTSILIPYFKKLTSDSKFDNNRFYQESSLTQFDLPNIFELSLQMNVIFKKYHEYELNTLHLDNLTLLISYMIQKKLSNPICLYMIENNDIELAYNTILLTNSIPNLKIIFSIDELKESEEVDFVLTTSYSKRDEVSYISSRILNAKFVKVIKDNVELILAKKKENLYKNIIKRKEYL